jgi:hypothetical protein
MEVLEVAALASQAQSPARRSLELAVVAVDALAQQRQAQPLTVAEMVQVPQPTPTVSPVPQTLVAVAVEPVAQQVASVVRAVKEVPVSSSSECQTPSQHRFRPALLKHPPRLAVTPSTPSPQQAQDQKR